MAGAAKLKLSLSPMIRSNQMRPKLRGDLHQSSAAVRTACAPAENRPVEPETIACIPGNRSAGIEGTDLVWA